MNTLAKYNEFQAWEAFLIGNSAKSGEDSGFLSESVINANYLQPGDKLLLRWGDEKSCEIECTEPMRFRVNASNNIKLKPGDTFSLHTLCVGHPIYISDIQRGNVYIPAYIGTRKGGLTTITRIF